MIICTMIICTMIICTMIICTMLTRRAIELFRMSGRDKLKCNKLALGRQMEESGLLYLLHVKHLLAFFCMHVPANPVFHQYRGLGI